MYAKLAPLPGPSDGPSGVPSLEPSVVDDGRLDVVPTLAPSASPGPSRGPSDLPSLEPSVVNEERVENSFGGQLLILPWTTPSAQPIQLVLCLRFLGNAVHRSTMSILTAASVRCLKIFSTFAALYVIETAN